MINGVLFFDIWRKKEQFSAAAEKLRISPM